MKNGQTIRVKNWKELKEAVEKINLYKHTLILSGWINAVRRKKKDNEIAIETKELIFDVVELNVLRK